MPWILAAIILGCGFGSADVVQAPAQPAPTGSGMLIGRVTIMGIPGASGGTPRPGPRPGGSPAPLAGASVVASPVGRGSVQSALTDEHGGYAITLLPGTYRVTMEAPGRGGITKNLPAVVTITDGRETRLDIHVDIGIR